MKKHLILLLTCVGLFSFAQDWNLINSNYVYNYAVDGNYEISVYSDSVEVLGSDTTFYLNRIVSDCDTCTGDLQAALLINQPTFLQREVLKLEDKYIFTDTLSFAIFPKANLNESWLFDTSRNITAEIISVNYETILGISDSIKYIQLSTEDTMVISKHNGIIRFDVPMVSKFHLIGIEKPTESLGFVVPKFADFFNFEVGDVFQYRKRNCLGGYGVSYHGSYIKQVVLSKEINGDTLKYYTEKKISGHSLIGCFFSSPMDTSLYYTFDTLIFIDSAQHICNLYRHELYSEIFPGDGYFIYDDSTYFEPVKVEDSNGIIAKGIFNTSYEDQGKSYFFNALNHQDLIVPFQERIAKKYKVGMGVTNFFHDWTLAGTDEFELIGCIKNGDTTGTVYGEELYTSMKNDLSKSNEISVYPNPINDYIYINTHKKDEAINVELYDIYGKLLIKERFDSKSTINFSLMTIESGVYVLRVNGVSQKVIKRSL